MSLKTSISRLLRRNDGSSLSFNGEISLDMQFKIGLRNGFFLNRLKTDKQHLLFEGNVI